MNRKRITLFFIFLSVTSFCSAQTNTFPASGNVGIGTTSPVSKLDINGGLSLSGSNSIRGISSFRNVIQILSPSHGAIMFNPGEETELMFGFHANGNFYWANATSYVMILNRIGEARIKRSLAIGGVLKPGSTLSVKGKISAQEVEVTTSNWPDYVFDEGYALPGLGDVEAFIKKHKHLPGMPDKAAAEEKGINLGEMNRKLLEKVEELTLHLIEMNKEVEGLKERLE